MAVPSNFLLEPTPHEEAAKWLRDKPVVGREVFDGLVPELRARAFFITGIEDANVVGEIREIAAQLPEGMPWEEAKQQLVSKLGPWLSAGDERQKAARARAELILRTHGFQAYQVAQHRVMRRQEDVFPFWQYLTLSDEKVRPGHAALDGKVAPANSPFWHDHSPPWQWGCRCRKVSLLPDEVDELKAEDASQPPEKKRVLEGPALSMAEQGRIYNAAGQQLDIKSDRQKGKSDGFVFDPEALTLPLKQLQPRYDPQTWAEFEGFAKRAKLDDGRTVWAWLGGVKAKAKAVKKVVKKATQAAAAVSAGGGPLVSSALNVAVPATEKAVADRVTAAIDGVHSDGVLPTAAVSTGTVQDIDALGDYRPSTNGIRFASNGDWPHLTLAHEIGHFIDRRALGDGSGFGSQQLPTAEWREWWKAIQDSASFKAITPRMTGSRKRAAYFVSPWEAWARSYAQFIATESGDAVMLADLDRVRGGAEPWRQWTDAEFAPIAQAMRTLFKTRGWMK